MTFSESINTCFRQKYATFSGRASRSEYWWFTLAYWLILIVSVVLVLLVGGGLQYFAGANGSTNDGPPVLVIIFMVLAAILFLAMLLPSIAVLIRRFHDVGISGWWYLAIIVVGMVPVIGTLIQFAPLVIALLKGTDGPNKYGPDPKNGGEAEIFA